MWSLHASVLCRAGHSRCDLMSARMVAGTRVRIGDDVGDDPPRSSMFELRTVSWCQQKWESWTRSCADGGRPGRLCRCGQGARPSKRREICPGRRPRWNPPAGEGDSINKDFICVLFGKPYKVLHFHTWSFAPLGSHDPRARIRIAAAGCRSQGGRALAPPRAVPRCSCGQQCDSFLRSSMVRLFWSIFLANRWLAVVGCLD